MRGRIMVAMVVAYGALAAACTSPSNDVDSTSSNTVSTESDIATTVDDTSTDLSIGEPDPDITIGTLGNGLRYMIRDNDNPGGRVTMRLVVDAGAVLQAADQDGVAHFVEHMMFNGTEQFPENELIDTLRSFGASFGADVNAYTTYDETVYELTMPTDDDETVATGLDVLEQWLSAGTIDPAQVESERGVVLDEWRGAATGSEARISEAARGLLLRGTPYDGLEILGSESAIGSMSAEPLRRFYDDWYRPDNAALVVVGDVDAGDIEGQIRERFESLAPRASTDERPAIVVEPPDAPDASVLADPDVAEAFAAVFWPQATERTSPDADAEREMLDMVGFDIVSTRLGNAALRGDAPFDEVEISGAGLVRGLDSRGVFVEADAADLEASTQAVFDEFERIRRFGVTDAEVERSVSSLRTAAGAEFEGRDSRQDADFADQYVDHLLVGSPIPTADDQFEFVTAILDEVTPGAIEDRLVGRLDAAAPQILVVVPEPDAASVPTESVFVDQATSVSTRDIEPLADDVAGRDALMDTPEPVEEVSTAPLGDGRGGFVDPVVLDFANGVQVSLNVTPIAEGEVAFEAASPGGLAVLADGDIAAGDSIATVIGDSGVGAFDTVALEEFVSDKDVELSIGLDAFTEAMGGRSTTDDLETLMQLVHLRMTEPVVDPLAVTRYVEQESAYAADPTVDPGYAEYVTLLDARYDDPRYLAPTVGSLATIEASDVERVFRDRFGDASDWSFSFSGDLDIDEVTELARRYLGTLPATGRVESVDAVEPPPPDGAVERSVVSGTGSQAVVALLFTEPATTQRRDDVAALLAQELVSVRLTDVIREALGESYSPYASVAVGAGPQPWAETYVSTTTSPELVDEVTGQILAELDDLATDGPSETEFASTRETVLQSLDLFSNEQINTEVLAALVDSAGNESFQDFIDQGALLSTIDRNDLRDYLASWIDPSQYIAVKVVSR